MTLPSLLALAFSYLAGSVPFGLLLGLLAGKDIRLHGSKNIGCTNLYRVCGARWGIPGFFLDAGKGILAASYISGYCDGMAFPWPGILCGLLAIIGHNFPVWLGFRGGKGVATSAGVVAALMLVPFVIAFASFIVIVAVFRYISLGSMAAAVILAVSAGLLLPDPLGTSLPLVGLAVVIAVMTIVRHRTNIRRLLDGTENRFPPKKTSPTGAHGK